MKKAIVEAKLRFDRPLNKVRGPGTCSMMLGLAPTSSISAAVNLPSQAMAPVASPCSTLRAKKDWPLLLGASPWWRQGHLCGHLGQRGCGSRQARAPELTKGWASCEPALWQCSITAMIA